MWCVLSCVSPTVESEVESFHLLMWGSSHQSKILFVCSSVNCKGFSISVKDIWYARNSFWSNCTTLQVVAAEKLICIAIKLSWIKCLLKYLQFQLCKDKHLHFLSCECWHKKKFKLIVFWESQCYHIVFLLVPSFSMKQAFMILQILCLDFINISPLCLMHSARLLWACGIHVLWACGIHD